MSQRIVLLVASLPEEMAGGMQVQAQVAAHELARQFEVIVLTRALRGPSGIEHRHGYTLVRKRVVDTPGARLLADLVQTVWHVARMRPVSALLCYQTLASGMIGVVTGRLLGIPTVVSIRGDEEFHLERLSAPMRMLSWLTWRLADRILVQSPRLREDFLRVAANRQLLAERVGVVPNAAPPGPSARAADRPDQLLTVARLHPAKGIPVLLEAIRGMPAEERPRLLLTGDGPLAASLRTAAHDLPVTFAGAVSHADVQSQLAQGGIFVLPSLEEGSPNVLLEALGHGLPIVATAVGGVPDLIRDGENGLLVPPGDPSALRGAIQRMRADSELRARLSACGPSTHAGFSAAVLGQSLAGEIRQVTRGSVADAFERLSRYLERRHLRNGALVGADPSGRVNLRLGRFLPLPGRPRLFLQSVGYWGRVNALRDASDHLHTTGDLLLARQRPDGAWSYADGSGRVATFDCTWAAIGLLEAYWATADTRYAEGSGRWLDYLLRGGGVRRYGTGRYVQYWSGLDIVVPNVSAELLWLASEQAKVRPSAELSDLMDGLLRFLIEAQAPGGELPYRLANGSATRRQHYLCYQYNAFELLAIDRYAENTGDTRAQPLLDGLAEFVLQGVVDAGGARSSCSATDPRVNYYAAALALALRRSEQRLGARARIAADRLVDWLLGRQRADGSFGYSTRDYGLPWLSDGHRYPRPLAMIAYTLGAVCALDNGKLGRGMRRAGVAL